MLANAGAVFSFLQWKASSPLTQAPLGLIGDRQTLSVHRTLRFLLYPSNADSRSE
jgi:hypothetical protein